MIFLHWPTKWLKGLSKFDESQENPGTNQVHKQAFEHREMPLGPKGKSQKIEGSKGHSIETALTLNNHVEMSDMQLLDQQIRSMMEKGQNRVQCNSNGKIKEEITRVCKVCGKEGRQTVLEKHIEANHITGVTHTCDICGKEAKTKNALTAHKSVYHRNAVK